MAGGGGGLKKKAGGGGGGIRHDCGHSCTDLSDQMRM